MGKVLYFLVFMAVIAQIGYRKSLFPRVRKIGNSVELPIFDFVCVDEQWFVHADKVAGGCYLLIYTVPVPLPAPAEDDAAAKGVEDQVKQGEDKAVKTAGSARGTPKAAMGSGGIIGPFLTIPETAFNDGEKAINGFMGILLPGIA